MTFLPGQATPVRLFTGLSGGVPTPAAPGSLDEPRPWLQPRVFDAADLPADPAVLDRVRQQTDGIDLAAPPVVLPDFHHKSKMEMPSSVAVATLDTIRPTLTSSSLNCGMALLALDCERPSRAAMGAFFRGVRERYPFPRGNRPELSYRDVVRCATEGAAFAAERWGVGPDERDRVEEGGRLDLDRYGGAQRLVREMPSLVFHLARLRFGSVGPSNHFVELQEVEEVYDEQAAALLGVRQGQLTLQYHAGGGMLTAEVGRIFGRRRDYPRDVRAAMAVAKPMYHLGSARSRDQLRERLSLYFSGGCPPVDRYGDEGRRLMLANAAAMNYGFAFRTTTYAFLRRLAVQAFGGRPGALVVDSPHNSVYEERVGDRDAVVHRHNSCRAYPAELMPAGSVFAQTGQAVLLPGLHRTSSYLAVAGPRAADSLHSACHGAGTVIEQFERSGVSGADPLGRSTLRYRYNDAAPTSAPHLDDRGVDAALAILVRHGLVRPVARMRPMAVLH